MIDLTLYPISFLKEHQNCKHMVFFVELILWSNKDRSYDRRQQEILNKGIANSKVEIVDGCAHNSHMEKPDLINLINSSLTCVFTSFLTTSLISDTKMSDFIKLLFCLLINIER